MRSARGTTLIVAAALALAGCGDVTLSSSEGGNDAERDLALHGKGNGYELTDISCPGMTDDRDEYDGKSVACTATARFADGSTKPIKVQIAYAKCSSSGVGSCQNIDITGDIRVRVRPN